MQPLTPTGPGRCMCRKIKDGYEPVERSRCMIHSRAGGQPFQDDSDWQQLVHRYGKRKATAIMGLAGRCRPDGEITVETIQWAERNIDREPIPQRKKR